MEKLRESTLSNKCSINPGEEENSSDDDGEYLEVDPEEEGDPDGLLGEARGGLNANKRTSINTGSHGMPQEDEFESFLVHFTGFHAITESSIEKEPGSVVIERAIIHVTDEGKDLKKSFIIRITGVSLDLFDLSSSNRDDKSNNISSIKLERIKFWGIRGHDFAFMLRSIDTPKCLSTEVSTNLIHCHVFRCEDDGLESASQRISNLLRENRLKMVFRPDMKASASFLDGTLDHETGDQDSPSDISTPDVEFFPTPVEEPFTTISARYLASVPVSKPSGIEILNDAIDRVIFEISRIKDRMANDIIKAATGKGKNQRKAASISGTKYSATLGRNSIDDHEDDIDDQDDEEEGFLLARKYYDVNCNIKISPSTIIVETISGEMILEGRVRYLSFMGISRTSVQVCGFILQVAESTFEAHIFECNPDAGVLCKTLEAACKLRYQKCLDAHRRRLSEGTAVKTSKNGNKSGSGLTSVKNMFSKMFLK
jgi:amyloid beta (A4) precursor protein-binding family B protein 2 (Fe65-like)